MSTANPSVLWDNRSTANFRAWAQAMHDSFAAVGMVQTTDTGQINISTAAPSSAGVYVGYEIWRFADSLQATKPVFVKVEYGSGVNSTVQAAARFTVSNGTNGAGTLNGTLLMNSQQIQGQYQTADTAPQPAFFCGDTSSIVFAWPTSNATAGFRPSVVMIERTRNTDGTPNGDAVGFTLMQGYGYGSNASQYGDTFSQLMSYLNTQVGPVYRWAPIASPNTYGYWDSAGSIGTDINLFPYLMSSPKPEAQALSLLGCYAQAMTVLTTAQVVVNGATHTYLALGPQCYCSALLYPQGGSWQNAANNGIAYGANSYVCSLLMRYE